MREYGFSLTCILPYMNRIYNKTHILLKTHILAYLIQCNAQNILQKKPISKG